MKVKITSVTTFKINVPYGPQTTSKNVKTAKQAAEFYATVRTNDWYNNKVFADIPDIDLYDVYQQKLYRRALKVFQKYLPPGK